MFARQGSFAHQLGDFLDRMFLHGDLGRSWTIGHRRVTDMVAEGLPADASLLIGSLVIGVIAGIAAGAVCAVRPKALISRLFGLFAAVAVCAPVYWVGLVVIFLFSPDIGSLGLPFVGGAGHVQAARAGPAELAAGADPPLAGARRPARRDSSSGPSTFPASCGSRRWRPGASRARASSTTPSCSGS